MMYRAEACQYGNHYMVVVTTVLNMLWLITTTIYSLTGLPLLEGFTRSQSNYNHLTCDYNSGDPTKRGEPAVPGVGVAGRGAHAVLAAAALRGGGARRAAPARRAAGRRAARRQSAGQPVALFRYRLWVFCFFFTGDLLRLARVRS